MVLNSYCQELLNIKLIRTIKTVSKYDESYIYLIHKNKCYWFIGKFSVFFSGIQSLLLLLPLFHRLNMAHTETMTNAKWLNYKYEDRYSYEQTTIEESMKT